MTTLAEPPVTEDKLREGIAKLAAMTEQVREMELKAAYDKGYADGLARALEFFLSWERKRK